MFRIKLLEQGQRVPITDPWLMRAFLKECQAACWTTEALRGYHHTGYGVRISGSFEGLDLLRSGIIFLNYPKQIYHPEKFQKKIVQLHATPIGHGPLLT